MSWWKRLALFTTLTIASAIVGAFLVCQGDITNDFATMILAAAVVIAPCWILLLPAVLLPIQSRSWHPALFLIGGPLVTAAIIPGEAYFFFTHTRGNAMREPSWFWTAALESALVAAAACGVYLISLDRLLRRRIQPTTVQ